MEKIEITAFFERKPKIFGYGVIGLRFISWYGCSFSGYEYEEFSPYYKFSAMDNLDFWERFRETLCEFFRSDDIVLREFGLPDLDELLADELFEQDDEACDVFWRNTLTRLEDSANQGHAFAQKLLSDYYSKLRNGVGGSISESLRWYEAAQKSGIIERFDDCEVWTEDEFDEEIEPFLFCGEYSTDIICEKEPE